jgi:hypothetical protein
MALVRTARDSGQSSTGIGTASFTTSPNFTPSNNSLLVVCASAVSSTAITATNLTIADSLGTLTWTSRATFDQNNWGIDDGAIRLWTAPVGTGASMTVTIDMGADSVDLFNVWIVDYTGYDPVTPIGVTGSFSLTSTPTGPKSLTLSGAPAATSEVIGYLVRDDSSGSPTSSPGATFTELVDVDTSGHGGFEVEARSGSTSTTVDWNVDDGTGFVLNAIALGFEIRAATAVGGNWRVLPPAPILLGLLAKAQALTGGASTTVSATALPGAFDIPFAFPLAAGSAGITATPGAFNVFFTFPLATGSAGATATPGAFNIPFAFPAATISAGATATPGAFNVFFTFPLPAVSAGVTATPGAFDIPFTFWAAAIVAVTAALPGAFNIPFTFPLPVGSAGATPTPGAFDIPFTFPRATVTTGGAGPVRPHIAISIHIGVGNPALVR